ncbi:probable methyltransferase-like protein 15 homolog [Panonychus citri]|uniref:probable methyltransferase-like protein 15 homolog n=1 Tax=Panonychus citri TaxID=50023 RepID=UPI002306F9A6|nr:probable methyltransferase-like protein 15 homolog [Panonychus citri]
MTTFKLFSNLFGVNCLSFNCFPRIGNLSTLSGFRFYSNQLAKRPFDFDEDEQSFPCHVPIMCNELVELFNPQDGQLFIDMTFGSGGHSKALLASGKDIKIIGMDRDPLAYKYAHRLAEKTNGQVIPLLAKFSQLPGLLDKHGIQKGSIQGIIMDLGASAMQMADPSRGFSFNSEGPLDMRMDGKYCNVSITADDVINSLDVKDLTKIFKIYGCEKLAAKYANAIIDCRVMMKRISSTIELANLIDSLASGHVIEDVERDRTSATRVFQGLRIFVNNELNELNYGLKKMRDYLFRDDKVTQLYKNNLDNMKAIKDEIRASTSGKLAVISYNRLEDTLTKRHLQGTDIDNPLTHQPPQLFNSRLHKPTDQQMERIVFKKWFSLSKIASSQQEIEQKSLTYPAKLRVAIRVL